MEFLRKQYLNLKPDYGFFPNSIPVVFIKTGNGLTAFQLSVHLLDKNLHNLPQK